MEQHDLMLEAIRLNGGCEVVPAGVLHRGNDSGLHGIGDGSHDDGDVDIRVGEVLPSPCAERQQHVHILSLPDAFQQRRAVCLSGSGVPVGGIEAVRQKAHGSSSGIAREPFPHGGNIFGLLRQGNRSVLDESHALQACGYPAQDFLIVDKGAALDIGDAPDLRRGGFRGICPRGIPVDDAPADKRKQGKNAADGSKKQGS